MNPNSKTICCLSCGRDTKARLGYCGRCTGEGIWDQHWAGQGQGRKLRPVPRIPPPSADSDNYSEDSKP